MANKRKKSTANEISSFLLAANKIVRDVNALNKGTIFDRVVRRVAGKKAGSGIDVLSDLFKK